MPIRLYSGRPATIGIGLATRGRGSKLHLTSLAGCPANMTPAADCMCRLLLRDAADKFTAWLQKRGSFHRRTSTVVDDFEQHKKAAVAIGGRVLRRIYGQRRAPKLEKISNSGRKRR